MASSDEDDHYWDAQKMLDLYLHDYLVKKKFHNVAGIFRREANVTPVTVAIDGFLNEWWSVFYEIYASTQLEHQEAQANSSVQAEQITQNELQNVYPIINQQRPGQFPIGPDYNKMLGQPPALILPATMYDQQQHLRHPVNNLNQRYLQQQFRNQGQQLVATQSRNEGINQVTSHPNLLRRAQQFHMLTDQSQQNLILSKTNLSGKDAQMKQTEVRQDSHTRHPQQQLPYGEVDEIESFLSIAEDKDNNPLGTLKHRASTYTKTDHKGFAFQEIGSLHTSKSKVLCCQFSSEGRLLASAGHDKKVLIWNMTTFDFNDSSQGHSSLITDVRFKPNSTILATSSFDTTLQIWDAAKPSKSLFKLLGHAEQVISLDFHPRKVDLLCSCDSSDEIRLWNVNGGACIKVSKQIKGATKQVRFQPQYGKLLATASGNSINLIDVENDNRIQLILKGHAKEVLSLCWDISGKYIASVSEDSARVWSLASGGNCMHELDSNGNKFQSCAFHPRYSQLLMVGGYQSLELWNPIDGNNRQSVSAHSGLISALAGSLETEMVASASHDRCVKLWK